MGFKGEWGPLGLYASTKKQSLSVVWKSCVNPTLHVETVGYTQFFYTIARDALTNSVI